MSVKTIGVAQMRELIDSGNALTIIDVRTPAEFAGVHAKGARLSPLDTLDPSAVAASRPNPADPLYVICQSGGRSAKACEKLEAAGITPVYSIEGGTSAWDRAGLPVERGDRHVISLERQVRITAGSLVLIGLVLAWAIHPYFLALTAFVGAGLVFAGVTDLCGMAILLHKMPWNRNAGG
jgi:rhodanese-related sulfurtransferase